MEKHIRIEEFQVYVKVLPFIFYRENVFVSKWGSLDVSLTEKT